MMNLNKILAALIVERDLLDKAIANLERISTGPGDSGSHTKRRVPSPTAPEKVRAAGAQFD